MDADADQENAGIELDCVIHRQQAGMRRGTLALVDPEPVPHGDDAYAERGNGSAECIHPHAMVSQLARPGKNTGRS
jgi:hypothetical protein